MRGPREDCIHFLVRTNATRKPLQPPYESTYKRLEREEHLFGSWRPQAGLLRQVMAFLPGGGALEGSVSVTSVLKSASQLLRPSNFTLNFLIETPWFQLKAECCGAAIFDKRTEGQAKNQYRVWGACRKRSRKERDSSQCNRISGAHHIEVLCSSYMKNFLCTFFNWYKARNYYSFSFS